MRTGLFSRSKRTHGIRLGWFAAAGVLALGSQRSAAADYTWNTAASNQSWSVNTNWTPSSPVGGPDSAGDFVLINQNVPGGTIINLHPSGSAGDPVKTIGRLDIGDLTGGDGGYTLQGGTGGGSLDFDGAGSVAQLNNLINARSTNNIAATNLSSELLVTNYSTNGIAPALTFSGVVSSTGNQGITIRNVDSPSGFVSFTATNTYTGSTTVTDGALVYVRDTNGSIAHTSSILVSSGGTLRVDNTLNAAKNNRLGTASLTLRNGNYVQVGRSAASASTSESIGALTLDSGANVITLTQGTGAGTSTLLTASSLVRNSGSTSLMRGSSLGQGSTSNNIALFRVTATPTGANGDLIGGGATAGSSNKNVSIIPYIVGDSSATGTGTTFVGYSSTNDTIRALNLTNEFQATLAGAGANDNVRLAATNTNAMSLTGTTVNALIFDTGTANGGVTSTVSGTLVVQSGALLFSRGASQAHTLTGGTLQFGASNSASSRLEGIISNSSGAVVTLSTQISGTGGLTLATYNANSVLVLNSTANDYTGTTTINGRVRLGQAGVVPDGSSLYVGQGGIFDLNGNSESIAGLSGTGTVDNMAVAVSGLTVGGGNVTATFSGVLQNTSGSLSVTKVGTGTQTLNGTHSYAGSTNINAGTLRIDSSLSASSAVNVADGATLAGTGTVGGAVSLVGGTTGASLESSGTLTLAGTLAVAGANNRVTAGTVAVAGVTSVANAASLAVDGMLTGAGSVSVNGTLRGTGTVAKAVTVHSGGTISPGASPGTLNTGSQTWAQGGTYIWEINDAAVEKKGQNAGYDWLNIVGILSLSDIAGGEGAQFIIDANSMTQTVATFAADGEYSWVIATASSGIEGFDTSKFAIMNHVVGANGAFTIGIADTAGSDDLVLSYSGVPEPGMVGLIGLGTLGILKRRRRRC